MKQTMKSVVMLSISPSGPALANGLRQRLEGDDQPVEQFAVLDDRRQQRQALARMRMLDDLEQRLAEQPVIHEILGAFDEPQIELVVDLAPRAGTLRRVIVDVVDEMAR